MATKTASIKPKVRRLHIRAGRKSIKLRKQIKSSYPKLPSSFGVFGRALGLIKSQWKLFVGITAVYSVLCLVLIGGVESIDVNDLKAQVNELLNNSSDNVWSSTVVFIYMANRSGLIAAGTAGAYQSIVILLTSLALIWTIRQVYASPSTKLKIRDGYYKGIYPFVQFLVVLGVVLLQLLPAIIGLFLYNLVSGNIAATSLELLLWGFGAIILVIWSLYMISSSLFAMYIVCLPDMTPLVALRTAKNLVCARRWTVLRKIMALPLLVVIMGAIIIIPVISFLPSVAGFLFSFLSMFSLVIFHAYMYVLYRELL